MGIQSRVCALVFVFSLIPALGFAQITLPSSTPTPSPTPVASPAPTPAPTPLPIPSTSDQALAKLVQSFSEACNLLPCPAVQYVAIWEAVVPQVIQTTTIMPREALAFDRISSAQTRAWVDTILDGWYEADGNTRLDEVQLVMVSGKKVAYRITYSQRAWYVGSSCKFDINAPVQQWGCIEGRVWESSYVSTDLVHWQVDARAPVSFKRL